MKLKTAIYIIDLFYGFFILLGLLGAIACILTLRNLALIIGIPAVVILFIIAFLIKTRLINFYLQTCKYPFEFLSVLEQLGLTKDLQVNWSEGFIDGPDKSILRTQDFLEDNKLTTEFGSKERRTFFQGENGIQCPFLSFQDNGLSLGNMMYNWSGIINWGFIDSDTHAGKMKINYRDGDRITELFWDLDQFNDSHIDLMLLLTHFKAKYG